MTDKKLDLTTREQALRVARMLGCQGAHEQPNGWMPCGSHEEYEAIKKGKEEYLKVLASKKKKPLPKMVQRTKRLETKSDAYYENRADALSISKARGCGGVRTVMLAGKRYYTPCDHKPRKGWEKLDEKPITGIATLPGGGLVTGSFSGKALGTLVGRPISGASEVDGDGDGLTSNASGEDIVPVVARNVLEQIKKIGPEGVEMQLAQRVKGLSSTLDDQDFSEVVAINPDRRQKIVSQYDRMPVLDENAKKAYDQFAGELDRQFKFLEEQGIKFEFVDEDPYKSFYEMHEDFIRNRRLKVMKTSVTGSHPYWSDATNDKFRAVHDVLGHLATGRGFDRHGEEAAYQAHKLTLPAEVHGALAMETRGQNAFLIERGDFPPQKAGILPDEMIKKIFDALHTKMSDGLLIPHHLITSDDDNLFAIGGSHHASGGRHFPKNKMKQKGFVNFVSRSTDPDTFSDPESARIRARNIGCIGIRRYTARDGKLVWMPCTNVSDYNRATGIRGDNSPRNNPRRRGSKFGKKSLGTPIGVKPSDEHVDGDGDGFTTGGIVGGEDKIPTIPKTIKKVFGFIGKLKYKLGSDGSIHPRALQEEIQEEAESLLGKNSTRGRSDIAAKKLVAKNLALAMSDVKASEIADTVLSLMPYEKEYEEQGVRNLANTVEEQMNLVKKISRSNEPLSFIVTDKGDIVLGAFSPAQQDAWVDKRIEIMRSQLGALKMNEEVNDETFEQFQRRQLRKEYQSLISKSTQYTHPSPESEQALKEATLRVLVASWAVSSNDSNPLSLAIQDVAQKMFKIDWAVGWDDDVAKRNFRPSTEFADDKVLKSFVKAQYDATQKYLAAKGIKKVTLYRGMQGLITNDYGDGSEIETAEILLRPLSAWSTHVLEADAFAGRGNGGDGVVIKATIPAQDIFSIPLTGFGCLDEYEVVIKSGAVDGIIREPIGIVGLAQDKSAKDQLKQWAYDGQTGEAPVEPPPKTIITTGPPL